MRSLLGGFLVGLNDPSKKFLIDIGDRAEFDVMHPGPRRRMDNLLDREELSGPFVATETTIGTALVM